MCPHPGSWSLAVAPPCLADDTKIIPNPAPRGGGHYKVRNIFLQKPCRKWGRKTNSTIFLFFKKALYEIKASGQYLSLIHFSSSRLEHTKKQSVNSLLIHRYTQFWFFGKGLESSFSITYCVWFFEKKNSHVIFLSDCPYFLRYALVIARFRVQYGQYVPSFSYFTNLFHEPLGEWNKSKTRETTKILAILCEINVR